MRRVVEAVVQAREPTVLELTLARPATIMGLVWDPDEEAALEGVDVRLLGPEGNPIQTTETDADGKYRFEGIRAGVYHVDIVNPAGYVTRAGTKNVSVGPNETLEVDFELRPGGVVRGRVVDEDNGEPLANVSVTLLDQDGRPLRTVRTTQDGHYEFLNVREDRYQLAIGDDSP